MKSLYEQSTQNTEAAQLAAITAFPHGRELLYRLSIMDHRELDLVCRFVFKFKPSPAETE